MADQETLHLQVVVSRALLEDAATISQVADAAAESAASSARDAVTRRARELQSAKGD